MKKIVTLTMNPTIDKNSVIKQLEPDRKLRCQEPTFSPGGGGINVARAIHNLGGEVKAIYPGGGPPGDMLEHLMNKENIPHLRIKTKHWTRENFAVIEETTNNQYRFEMPGAFLYEEEWDECFNMILKESQGVDFLVVSGSLPPSVPDDFYARLAQRTRNSNLRLIIDTSGEPLKKLIGSGVYLLKPNLREFRELTGRALLSEEEQENAAKELIFNGTCEVLVLSLGAEGLLLVTRDITQRFHSPIVPVQSRIGAGDSTVGGIVLGLSRAMNLKDAVLFGIASGTSTVMTPVNELCRRNETERIFKQIKEVQ